MIYDSFEFYLTYVFQVYFKVVSLQVNMHLKPTATCFSDNFGSTSIRGQGFKVSWVVYMASWLAPNKLDGKG
jgi:hypothetical protein